MACLDRYSSCNIIFSFFFLAACLKRLLNTDQPFQHKKLEKWEASSKSTVLPSCWLRKPSKRLVPRLSLVEGNAYLTVTHILTSLPMDICSLSFSSVFLRDLSNRADLSFHSSKSSFWSFWSLGIFFTILQKKKTIISLRKIDREKRSYEIQSNIRLE